MLSRFRTRLTAAKVWDGLLNQINRKIQVYNITVKQGCHVDSSITQSPRKPKTKPAYEVIGDREERDDEIETEKAMQVIEVTQLGVDTEARWVKKGDKSLFGYKQHTLVDGNGFVVVVEITAANCHDSKLLLDLLDKAKIQPGIRIHADKAVVAKSAAML